LEITIFLTCKNFAKKVWNNFLFWGQKTLFLSLKSLFLGQKFVKVWKKVQKEGFPKIPKLQKFRNFFYPKLPKNLKK